MAVIAWVIYWNIKSTIHKGLETIQVITISKTNNQKNKYFMIQALKTNQLKTLNKWQLAYKNNTKMVKMIWIIYIGFQELTNNNKCKLTNNLIWVKQSIVIMKTVLIMKFIIL